MSPAKCRNVLFCQALLCSTAHLAQGALLPWIALPRQPTAYAWFVSWPQVSQHEQCRIRVTISPEPGQTGEHKVSLEDSRGCGAQALVCSRIRSCVLSKPACIPVLKG